MWKYDFITIEEFGVKRKKVEDFITAVGGKVVKIDLPYNLHFSEQKVFNYNGRYYRVDAIEFENKPHFVIECGSLDEVIKNIMNDADPFPYDLRDEEILKEVKYSLGILAYPQVNN